MIKNKLIILLFIIGIEIQAVSLKNAIGFGETLCKPRDSAFAKTSSLFLALSSKYPFLFSRTSENILFSLSQLQAKQIFWQAYKNVPAYKDFIDENCSQKLPHSFSNIPVMSKSNYIKKYTIKQTLVSGKLPLKGQIDTSTGTSGKPTLWIRGHQEMENVKSWIRIASKVALSNKNYVFCNMFALGPWATGMTATYALAGNQLIVSIGPDLNKFYDILQELGNEQSYVIAGYPPHMKKLVENAPFNLDDYDITMVVGGEALSENVYRYIKDKGIKEVYSSYGASDLRINIAQQTEFEQKLQSFCKENPQFKKELLGSLEGTPLFFHYNPLLDYIEETNNGDLLFTDLDASRISPRVRYGLGDKGKVLKMSTIKNLIKQYGYKLVPQTNLPILCLYGRGDDALTYNGANLMYDDLERALVNIGLYDVINRYAYNKFETEKLDQKLEFWIELKENIPLNDLNFDPEKLNLQLITALSEINQDFRAQVEYADQDAHLLPSTFLFKFGESPMVEQSAHHKNKYVYNITH